MVKLLSMNAAAGKIFPSRMIVWLVPVLLFLAAVAAPMASAGVLRVAGSFVPAAAADGTATGLAGAAENVAAAAGTAADNAVANGIIRTGEQAGAEGVVNAAPLTTNAAENPVTGTALARQLGQEGERAADIVKNTERINSLTGTADYRVPDILDHAAGLVGEVKNVATQGFTRQIQDYLYYALQNNYDFVLVVRQGGGTAFTAPLQALIDSGFINILRMLP